MYIAFQNIKCKKCGFPCPVLYCNCLYLHCCYIVFLLYLPVSSLPQQLMREHYTYYLTQLLGSQPLIPSFPRLLLLLSDIFHRGFFHFQPLYFFKLVELPQISSHFLCLSVFIQQETFSPHGTQAPTFLF